MVDELSPEITSQIAIGRELRGLEFKTSVPWSDVPFRLGLVKDCMAMSNLADGGLVVIGVSEPSPGDFNAEGMTQDDFETFEPDHFGDFLSQYADSPFTPTMHKGTAEGRIFVAIQVPSSRGAPTICRRDNKQRNEEVFRGAIYIRPLGKPETRRVSSEIEMRELIDRAVDRSAARLRDRGWERPVPETKPELDDELGKFA